MPRPCPITPTQKDEIVARYQAGESRNRLAAEFKYDRNSVTLLLRRRGVHVRGPAEACLSPLRHDAFADAADCDEAAYWVGMLMADGCISLNGGWDLRSCRRG